MNHRYTYEAGACICGMLNKPNVYLAEVPEWPAF
jgi:hypothetical protein